MVLDHEIFAKPYAVTPTLVEEPHNRDAERTVLNWTIYRDVEKHEIGLVSNRDKLAGAPDTEILSGGVNSKGDRGVALAREANMFQWGFTGPPSAMTEEAQQVFINAICYIAKFDGHTVHADAPTQVARMALATPTQDVPVTTSAAILAPSAAKGATVTLAIRARVADGWHIYGEVPDGSAYPPTVFELDLPDGVEAVGAWKMPAGRRDQEGHELLEGELLFSRQLRIGQGASWLATVNGTMRFQVCNEQLCLPPGEHGFTATLPIQRR